MDDDLNERRRRGLYRTRRRLQSAQGARVVIDGRDYVNFSSNDYLGLAADPRLAKAAASAARRYGTGAGASPLVSGLTPPLRRLERTLAEWEGTEAALVFSSGYAANLAVVSTLASREDAIFSDAWNHASIIDGCRLSGARIHVYRHPDVNHLADLLRLETKARRRVIVSDSVFSMDGDFAPLLGLLELSERYDALLILDEAHATGVLGESGRGLTELLDVAPTERLIKVGTLSKALGAQGGFVCGSRRLIAWLVNHARPYIFSTALAPPSAATAARAVEIVQAEPEVRRHIHQLAEQLREGLSERGFNYGGSRCQIVPVLIGEPNAALRLSAALQEAGLLVPAIRPPSVPVGTARLRISLTAGHGREDVEQLLQALPNAAHIEKHAGDKGNLSMPAKPIQISGHALFEMERRGISPAAVRGMVRRPGQVLPSVNGRHIYQGLIGRKRRLLLRVVVKEDAVAYHVVTAYKTSKITKYWRNS